MTGLTWVIGSPDITIQQTGTYLIIFSATVAAGSAGAWAIQVNGTATLPTIGVDLDASSVNAMTVTGASLYFFSAGNVIALTNFSTSPNTLAIGANGAGFTNGILTIQRIA
ncbi:hypothetical protein COF04_30830 [Bacillus toyonensis]|nr:hypothetical protein COF04_30830 [Bacillus toyonensis]